MAYHTLRLIVLDAANKCPELSIANAKKITYSDPKGPNGKRDEGSIATYTCKNGFKKAGNKDKRECKKGNQEERKHAAGKKERSNKDAHKETQREQ